LPTPEGAASACVRRGAGARILVVDDDATVRWVTVECLREIGYSVTEADNGTVALTLLERDSLCDLVVMDQVMPGLSGLDTVRLARRARPEVKVLFLSGYTRCGEEVGRDIWLQKPFKTEALAEAVSRALQWIEQILFQVTSAIASVGRVKTSSHLDIAIVQSGEIASDKRFFSVNSSDRISGPRLIANT
jgi:CheY-like chemotaxis protein